MGWFTKMCRGFGELVHDVVAPVDGEKNKDKKAEGEPKTGVIKKEVVNRKVEEEQVDETTILRRTTIEEIEVKREKVEPSDKQGDG